MAGMGLSTGTARCYDWYMDYLKVRSAGRHDHALGLG